MGFCSQIHHRQLRKERSGEPNVAFLSLGLWQKGTVPCQRFRSAEGDGWGRLAKADFTVLWGGCRKEGRSGGCEEMSSPGASMDEGGERERKGPPPIVAETVEKQISVSVGFGCFSRKWQKQ